MVAARASLRPWLSSKGLAPLTGMLSVWPTTVTLPISSWFAAITWPIEAISGSKPVGQLGAGRAEELGVGPLDDERGERDASRCPSAPGAGPRARPASNSGTSAKSTGSAGRRRRRRGVARRAEDLGPLGAAAATRASDGELLGLAGEAEREQRSRSPAAATTAAAKSTQSGTAKRRGASAATTPCQFGESGAGAASGSRRSRAAAVRTAASERAPARPGTRYLPRKPSARQK